MASTNNRKESDRLSIMVPRNCKNDIEFIITQTGIKSNGELFRLMLARYKDDFVSAYNEFYARNSAHVQQNQLEVVPVDSVVDTNKPVTNAMSF